jgi:DNA-directed RNA polymerase subunit RPC12/RpoP
MEHNYHCAACGTDITGSYQTCPWCGSSALEDLDELAGIVPDADFETSETENLTPCDIYGHDWVSLPYGPFFQCHRCGMTSDES